MEDFIIVFLGILIVVISSMVILGLDLTSLKAVFSGLLIGMATGLIIWIFTENRSAIYIGISTGTILGLIVHLILRIKREK